jgi:DNA mismatch repair protein MutS
MDYRLKATMDIDITTYNDLSLFHHEEEFSVFHKLNYTRTSTGKLWLEKFFNEPFSDIKKIQETQQIVSIILSHLNEWPTSITNGTIMVIERLYESPIDNIPDSANIMNALSYKVLHAPDYSLVRYSLTHFADFIRGFGSLIRSLQAEELPTALSLLLGRATDLMNHHLLESLSQIDTSRKLTASETVLHGNHVLYRFKSQAQELINIFGRLDAWQAMATTMVKHNLVFPKFVLQNTPYIEARQLYHILLTHPVPYDIHLSKDSNFLFMTGANMAGKSTFIKAVGTTVFLAHLGMGVPAKEMTLSLFDGILSNINVVDNIVKGESYFFNEVQRIKNTILKINDGRKWLVLIDELFKGTNVQDAMKCSTVVIKGLIRIQNSLFILSTHLYEIGEELRQYSNISFEYFETTVNGDQLEFSYQLKEGISNDRLGYLILKKEKVVDLLEKL